MLLCYKQYRESATGLQTTPALGLHMPTSSLATSRTFLQHTIKHNCNYTVKIRPLWGLVYARSFSNEITKSVNSCIPLSILGSAGALA